MFIVDTCCRGLLRSGILVKAWLRLDKGISQMISLSTWIFKGNLTLVALSHILYEHRPGRDRIRLENTVCVPVIGYPIT